MAEARYTLTVLSNRETMGTVSPAEPVRDVEGTIVHLVATAEDNHTFLCWSDGNTQAVRDFVIPNKDMIIRAYFYQTNPVRYLLDLAGLSYFLDKIKSWFGNVAAGTEDKSHSGATQIGFCKKETSYTAENVQGALEEVKSQADTNTSNIQALDGRALGLACNSYVSLFRYGGGTQPQDSWIQVNLDAIYDSSRVYGIYYDDDNIDIQTDDHLTTIVNPTAPEEEQYTYFDQYKLAGNLRWRLNGSAVQGNSFMPVEKNATLQSAKTYVLFYSQDSMEVQTYQHLASIVNPTAPEEEQITYFEYYRRQKLLRYQVQPTFGDKSWNSALQEGFEQGMPHSGIMWVQMGYNGGCAINATGYGRIVTIEESDDVLGELVACIPVIKGVHYTIDQAFYSREPGVVTIRFMFFDD